MAASVSEMLHSFGSVGASPAFLNLKCTELKEVCINAGLPRSGRKEQLQQRILSALRHGNRVQLALEQLLGRSVGPPVSVDLPPISSIHGQAGGPGRSLSAVAAPGATAALDPFTTAALERSATLDPFLPPADPPLAGPWSCTARGSLPACMRIVLPNDAYRRLVESSGKLQLVVRSFKSDQPYHRWPLGSAVHLNRSPLAIHQVPPAWDGIDFKDRKLDQPLVVPAANLRPGPNELELLGQDMQPHVLVAQLCVPTSVDAVRLGVERDGALEFDACRMRMLHMFGGSAPPSGKPTAAPAAPAAPGVPACSSVPGGVGGLSISSSDGVKAESAASTMAAAVAPPPAPTEGGAGKAGVVDDDDDDDLVQSSVRLSLTCPLSRTRLKVPVRGDQCRHLECFDLSSYLEMAQVTKPAKWKCPMCNRDATPGQLRVDAWVAWVLQAALPKAADVVVAPDGAISEPVVTTAPRKRKHPESSGMGGDGGGGAGSSAAPDVMCIDDDDDDGGGGPAPSGGGRPPGGDEDNPICLDDD